MKSGKKRKITNEVILAIYDNDKTADVDYIAWHTNRTKESVRRELDILNTNRIVDKNVHPRDKRKNVYKMKKGWKNIMRNLGWMK